MTIVVLAEKPSVARDIAVVLGATKRHAGYLEGSGYCVTWAVGHLVGLAEPGGIDAAWARWSYRTLPMLPSRWPLVEREGVEDQLAVVRKLLTARNTKEVVCATDAGREGELIFRYLYEHVGCQLPVRRLWISSLTAGAIKRGFARLEPAERYDGLAAAARARSRADWLVGMNLSRAYSLRFDDNLSVGRVQTPTLALVVDRELAIQKFVPEPYREVRATFAAPKGKYRGIYLRPLAPSNSAPSDSGKAPGQTVGKGSADSARFKRSWLPAEGDAAESVSRRALAGKGRILDVQRKKHRELPPRLFDLTELQRCANRLFGMSAKRTLEVAQTLYEKHKLISYPRTDSRHLSNDDAATLPSAVAAIADRYGDAVPATALAGESLSARFVDDAKVTDHHAIIPTSSSCQLPPDSDAFKLYDLVCRRLLQAWCDDYVEAVTSVVTAVAGQDEDQDFEDHYSSRGTAIEELGWKVLEATSSRAPRKKPDLPGGLANELPVEVQAAEIIDRTTKPPLPLTDASLLTAMETAGRTLDDKELSEAMRKCGLGTPATRAATIESLLSRQYLRREGAKALRATDKGISLIGRVHEHVRSAAMTGSWESRLQDVQTGDASFDSFMRDIEAFVAEVVGRVKSSGGEGSGVSDTGLTPSPAAAGAVAAPTQAPVPAPRREVVGREGLGDLLRKTFGFANFRPHQLEICGAVTEGRDALVVMPTGAGKSLCYQLPGVARAGTTLVISPLVALIEDQVQKLQSAGLRADCIHAGRGRPASRQVCRAYLDGQLDYLFIAPERLAVRGFPQMLAKRPPTLIAIDEAHCISDWGHDFRPDYRMLRQRLEPLRQSAAGPVPIVALTATATPEVQRDICSQLGLADSNEFIFGFRRTNIAVEVVEVAVAQRPDMALRLLLGADRVPAIVYAPTRKAAEHQARAVGKRLRAGAYHAGMPAEKRDQVQRAFAAGKLDVVVATVAFGMGIDKADVRTVIHTALPNTVEAYYQEIGRAGRDGKPSRAVLMHNFADVRTLEFFLEKDYPPAAKLARVYKALSAERTARDVLSFEVKGKPQEVEGWIDKLWVAGGAEIDDEGDVRRGAGTWKGDYEKQRTHKQAQLDAVRAFARSNVCRMNALVKHFGDQADDGAACGLCDMCAPGRSLLLEAKQPDASELTMLANVIEALRGWNGQASGRLYREVAEATSDRSSFERLLAGLERAGIVVLRDDSFDKDGERIAFQRIDLVDPTVGLPELAERVVLTSAPVLAAGADKSSRAHRTGGPSRGKGKGKGAFGRRRGSARPNPRTRHTIKARPKQKHRKSAPASAALADIEAPQATIAALRSWRSDMSRIHGIPAYRILTDRQLGAVAVMSPGNEDELSEVGGIGRKTVKLWADGILEALRLC